MSILKTFLSECIQNIVDSTNKYTEILLENLHFQARMNNSQRLMLSLKLTNFDWMWLYITVTLLMGIVKMPQYHNFQTYLATSIFSRLMHQDR